MRPIIVAAAASLALIGVYLALGGASYAPARVADPCAPRDWRNPQGLQHTAEQIVLSALDGAACKLHVSREDMVLAFSSRASLARFASPAQCLDAAARRARPRRADAFDRRCRERGRAQLDDRRSPARARPPLPDRAADRAAAESPGSLDDARDRARDGCADHPDGRSVRAASIRSSRPAICRSCSSVGVTAPEGLCSRLKRDTNVLVMVAVMTVRKPIPTNMTSAATSRPATVAGTWSPYPTVVTVWTDHQSPDPTDGKLSWSATVIRIPAPTVIEVDTVAITRTAPRGRVARASTRSSRRSSLVSSATTVEFALAGARPAAAATRPQPTGTPRRDSQTLSRAD